MSAKKKDKKEARSREGIDRGTVAGGLAASLVLVVWAFVQVNGEARAKEDVTPTRPSTPTTVPNQEAPPVQLPPPPVEPSYKQEIRDAIALGKEGLKDFEKALQWKEDIGGDPFKFANMVDEAAAKVTRSVLALEALREEAKGDPVTQKNVDEWVAHFESKMPVNRK